jgi:ribosome-associated protein
MINESEIQIDFIHSSGPGGQNVNKVATAAQLRFDIRNSTSISADVKERLAKLAGSRVTTDGVLIIEARRFRSQEKNRRDAIDRLYHLIAKAEAKPVLRLPTRPSVADKESRLQDKKVRSGIKQNRRRPSVDND